MTIKIKNYIDIIDKALERKYIHSEECNNFKNLIDSVNYSLLNGGKRIRPVLTLAFCELCGGEIEEAVELACAVEMIHTYSLIHDDLPCMDDDDMRRGKKSNHLVYGEDTALLAGDALLTDAFKAIAQSNLSDEKRIKAVEILALQTGSAGMVAGQCIDLESEGKSISLEVLEEMDMKKTVALISAACKLGCVAASNNEKDINAAGEFAIGLGMAFQIRDDILDVIGNESALGKSIGSDEDNNKRNYVNLLGIKKAQELVESYTSSAMKALEYFSGDTRFLKDLATKLIERES